MLIIPVRATPNQALQAVLGGQNCSLRIYTRTDANNGDNLYLDLNVNNADILLGQLCLQFIGYPMYGYLNFTGELMFVDMQGNQAPQWAGLGERWQLIYLSQTDLQSLAG